MISDQNTEVIRSVVALAEDKRVGPGAFTPPVLYKKSRCACSDKRSAEEQVQRV